MFVVSGIYRDIHIAAEMIGIHTLIRRLWYLAFLQS